MDDNLKVSGKGINETLEASYVNMYMERLQAIEEQLVSMQQQMVSMQKALTDFDDVSRYEKVNNVEDIRKDCLKRQIYYNVELYLAQGKPYADIVGKEVLKFPELISSLRSRGIYPVIYKWENQPWESVNDTGYDTNFYFSKPSLKENEFECEQAIDYFAKKATMRGLEA